MPNPTLRARGLALVTITAALAACSSGGTGPTSADLGAATPSLADGGGASSGPADTVGTSGPVGSVAGSAGQTSVRIGNFYDDQNLKAGPALDLYDTPTGQAGTPILTAVAYGSFSAYVHPHESGGLVVLYVLPAGEDPVANAADARGIGGYQDDGSQLQETFILASQGNVGPGCITTGPICELDTSSVVEKGDDANGGEGPVASPPAAGQAELLVSSHAVDDENLHGSYYFFVDASCDPPLNGDASQEPGLPYVFATSAPAQSIFPTQPGTHQISVVQYSNGSLPTCAGLAPKQGLMSVQVSAGQQVLVYIYGTSLTDLHLAVGADPAMRRLPVADHPSFPASRRAIAGLAAGILLLAACSASGAAGPTSPGAGNGAAASGGAASSATSAGSGGGAAGCAQPCRGHGRQRRWRLCLHGGPRHLRHARYRSLRLSGSRERAGAVRGHAGHANDRSPGQLHLAADRPLRGRRPGGGRQRGPR